MSDSPGSSPPGSPPASANRGSRLASIAVASALFMEFVDSTALSTALPTLSVAFGTDPIHLKLALTSYILALAVLAPASGWIADRFGPRRVFMLAMGVFLIASVLCGFSRTLPQLVIFRTLQGLGGALMTPVGRLIVVGSAPRDQLVSALSWFTMPALVGPLIGPPLAGLILGVADWPWIFFINVPVGLLGMLAVSRYVPELPQPHPGPFDWRGYAIAAVAITLTIGAAETLGVGLVPIHIQMGMALIAVGALALYVSHALRMKKPVLDLRLLKLSTFRASTAGGGLVRMGLGATPFLLPLMLQVGLGWGPFEAGLVTIGTGLGAMSCKPVAPWVIKRLGFRTTLVGSNLAAAVLTALPAIFRNSTPIPLIVVTLFISGFVRSLQFTAINAVAYADIPREKMSQASTVAVVTQQMALSVGISLGALMLHLARGSENLPLTPDRFLLPFLAVGVVSSLAGPLFSRLPEDAGSRIGGRAAR